MTHTDKISKQVAKVRAKIAEYKAADDFAFGKLEAINYDADIDTINEAEDAYLEASKLRNRIGGELKKMTRKAVELYYGSKCLWFKFNTVSQYINAFNETFYCWN